MLTTAEWIDIVDGPFSGPSHPTISGRGLHARFVAPSLVAFRIAGIDRAMLVTNARIDDGRASMIEMQAEHAGLHLHVSLDGGSAATHD